MSFVHKQWTPDPDRDPKYPEPNDGGFDPVSAVAVILIFAVLIFCTGCTTAAGVRREQLALAAQIQPVGMCTHPADVKFYPRPE